MGALTILNKQQDFKFTRGSPEYRTNARILPMPLQPPSLSHVLGPVLHTHAHTRTHTHTHTRILF